MEEKLQLVVEYIIRFLLPNNENLAVLIGYTNNTAEFSKFKVVIRPSSFFNKEVYGCDISLPSLPLHKIDDIDLLFGTPHIEQNNGTVVVDADIIASSFFLLSRYEEFIGKEKLDEHHRFDGKKSLPYRANFINRPIVEQYSHLLIKWLNMAGIQTSHPPCGFSNIYLTHDIDAIGLYQHIRGALSGFYQSIFSNNVSFWNVLQSICNHKKDPAYTFQWLIGEDQKVANADIIFFVKALQHSYGYDLPHYSLSSNKMQELIRYITHNHCKIGLHSSYHSFANPESICQEHDMLERQTASKTTLHRSHYLTVQPPYQPQYYTASGITDDFSMGYASVAGFRLGTCRAVKWINPANFEINPITLHPMTIMECSLSNENYMNLDYDEALIYSTKLITEVKKYGGELNLLWHNTSITPKPNNYHTKLYKNIIDLIQ